MVGHLLTLREDLMEEGLWVDPRQQLEVRKEDLEAGPSAGELLQKEQHQARDCLQLLARNQVDLLVVPVEVVIPLVGTEGQLRLVQP